MTDVPGQEATEDEFWDNVGTSNEPLNVLSKSLKECGKTEFEVSDGKIHIEKGAKCCPSLSLAIADGVTELFCFECGLTVEIKIDGADLTVSPEEDDKPKDDMDEFLDRLGTTSNPFANIEDGRPAFMDDDDGDDE